MLANNANLSPSKLAEFEAYAAQFALGKLSEFKRTAPLFAALGDETRLALVVRLLDGPPQSIAQLTSSTEVTRPAITRQSVTKHLRVLTSVGLVRSVRVGRESRYELDPKPIVRLREYLELASAHWDRALGRLKSHVEGKPVTGGGPMSQGGTAKAGTVKKKLTFAESQELLEEAYRGFNARDMEKVLSLMDPDVNWPNAVTGERLHGRDEVREYWSAQWKTADPQVEPKLFAQLPWGGIEVSVHQVVRDLDGKVLDDRMVKHAYTINDGLIRHMAIEV
jgi:DNA-binding transcriptional ArsR family regulator